MTIPKLTPYTGQVANPDGSQTQTEFTQNMFDQLSYEATLATELDATVDGMNQAVTDVENNANAASASATAAEAAASTAGYQGLWPDTGGSAEKGETYQTQVGGAPTGEYYTALKNTSVDPVGDNVNWKRNGDVNVDILDLYTSVNINASGAKEGGDDNSALINAIAQVSERIVVPSGEYYLNSDVTIPSSCTLEMRGMFVVNGSNLTVNGPIDAGHYQIFKTQGGGEVLPSYYNNSTLESDAPKVGIVKAAWFGVKNDAKHPATKGTPQSGTNQIGDQPTGTDSTDAMKAALKFAQYASFKSQWFDDLNSGVVVELEPSSRIILRGDNPMGSQVMLDAISRMRSLSDFTTDPEYNDLTFSTFDYRVELNGSTILYVPESQNDTLLGESVNINQLFLDNGIILPVGFSGVGWGRLLNNETLLYAGSSGRDKFFNALTQQYFTNVWWSVPQDDPTGLGVDGRTNPSGIIFNYEGYSLGDRLRIKGGNLRNFTQGLRCVNPEAVEIAFDDTTLTSYADNTIFHNVGAHYSQYKIDNCLHLMKGDNQKLLNFIADYSAGYQTFSTSSAVRVQNSRMEGADGNSKTLINANFGRFIVSDIFSNTAMSAEDDGSLSVNLQRLATAKISHSTIPTKFSIGIGEFDGTNPDIDQYRSLLRTPMLTLEDCNFSGNGGRGALMHVSRFNGNTYGQAIKNIEGNNLLNVPVVEIIESPNTSRESGYGWLVPFCRYYGTWNVPQHIDTYEFYTDVNINGFTYPTLDTRGWQFPPWARINKLLMSVGPTTNAFTHIVISIGDGTATEFKRIFSLAEVTGDPAWYNKSWVDIDLLSDTVSSATGIPAAGNNPVIGTPTGDPAKLNTRILYTDASGTPIAGNHPPTKFKMEYRAMKEPSEVLNIGDSGVNIR